MKEDIYIIAGRTNSNEEVYYGYSLALGRNDWVEEAIEEADFMYSIESAKTVKRYVIKNKDMYPYIKQVWIEKITTQPIPEDTATEL